MENAEPFSSSTAPLTWHDFLERMRHPSATEFVKAIKSFIVSFSNNPPNPETDSASVQEFLANMESAFRAHPLWAGRSEEELDSAGEGLEKYIMTKLYPRVFATHPDDTKTDDQLYEKLALIQQFIRPENLDIQPTYQNETSWLLAQKELQKINIYKAPRDKLVCILSCCKVISNLLMNASVAASESLPGADEFLPVLIYVTIKANPPQLHSNLSYIQRYRRESRLVGEAAYYFTNMLSAEAFIMNIDGKALSMEETEFQRNMESAQALIYGLAGDYNADKKHEDNITTTTATTTTTSTNININTHTNTDTGVVELRSERGNVESLMNKIPSVSDLENKGAAMIMKDGTGIEELRNYPYLYSRAGDLTVGDVEELLDGYKRLVFRYVCLAKGLGVPVPPVRSPETRNDGVISGLPENTGVDVEVEDGRLEGRLEGGTGVFSGNSEVKAVEEVAGREEDNVE